MTNDNGRRRLPGHASPGGDLALARNGTTWTTKAFAILVVLSMTLASLMTLFATPAKAAGGAGGSGGNGGGPGSNPGAASYFYDDPTGPGSYPQGTGEASIERFIEWSELLQYGPGAGSPGIVQNARDVIYNDCRTALTIASQRGGFGNDISKSRVVAFLWALSSGGFAGSPVPSVSQDRFFGQVNGWVTAGYPGFLGHSAHSADPSVADLVVHLADEEIKRVNSQEGLVSFVCVTLNEDEPLMAPPNYTLSLTTDAQGAFTQAGGTDPVWDRLNTSSGGSSIREDLSGEIRLHYSANGSRPSDVNAVKSFSGVSNVGDGQGHMMPRFTPSDLGMSYWLPGKYWWDVAIPKQGNMANGPVNVGGFDDPRESWTGRGYDLGIVTTAQSTFPSSGGDEPVHDQVVTTSPGWTHDATLDAKITLNWDGMPASDTVAKSVTKDFTVPNHGTVNSPDFTPSDFGWDQWPGGRFWYGITVAQQDHMNGPASTDDRVQSETWNVDVPGPGKVLTDPSTGNDLGDAPEVASGTTINAEISMDSAGASSFWIQDTLYDGRVWLGGKTSDDTSKIIVKDPSGEIVPSDKVTVTITGDEESGKVALAHVVLGEPTFGTYTMVVPTTPWPTATDYVFADRGQACWGEPGPSGPVDPNEPGEPGEPCKPTEPKEPGKVTPEPNKVWTLDDDGSLVATDPGWTNQEGADNSTFLPGDPVSAVVNDTIRAGIALPFQSYTITDDWSQAAKYVDFTGTDKVKVMISDGAVNDAASYTDVTSQFDITQTGTTTTATAKKGSEFLAQTQGLAQPRHVKLLISGTFYGDTDTEGATEELKNAGSVTWNNNGAATNVPSVFIRTPDPDKAWVLDEEMALETFDPEWTNEVGADWMTFIHTADVATVVNGSLPKDLALPLKNYQIADTWSDEALRYIAAEDSEWKVFVQAGTEMVDVSDQFDMAYDAETHSHIATAKAGSEILKTSANQPTDRKVKLYLASQFRPLTTAGQDGVTEENETDTHGELVKMLNSGWEQWNDSRRPTNKPPVFIWNPEPDKEDLYCERDEAGTVISCEDIDGKFVQEGDRIDYRLTMDADIPGTYVGQDGSDGGETEGLARVVHRLGMIDDFDSEYLSINPVDIRVIVPSDEVGPFPSEPGEACETDEEGNLVDPECVDPEPEVAPEPDSETDEGSEPAVPCELDEDDNKVDPECVDPEPEVAPAPVCDQTFAPGCDATEWFNITVQDGVAYVFAKVGSYDADGVWTPDENQPTDLAQYYAEEVSETSPVIDQALLGRSYWIYLPARVIKETNDYTIINGGEQVFENNHKVTKEVSNPQKLVPPFKDVTMFIDGESINHGEVPLLSKFQYLLGSSVLPADRANPVHSWYITDDYNREADRYTGEWVIQAQAPLYDGQDLLAEAGDVIAVGGWDEETGLPLDLLELPDGAKAKVGEFCESTDANRISLDASGKALTCLKGDAGRFVWTDAEVPTAPVVANETLADMDLFTVEDNEGTLVLTATEDYLDLVNSRQDAEAGWQAYLGFQRIWPGEWDNELTEHINFVPRTPPPVTTTTPENPDISLVKYDIESGIDAGDRNEMSEALTVTKDGTKIGFLITNTGDVPLKNVTLDDETTAGTGTVEDITCEPPLEGYILDVGETILCTGTLKGLQPGTSHTDVATTTGESIYTGEKVTDTDPWNAKGPGGGGDNLRKTGADLGIAGVAILLLGAGGYTAYEIRRRNNRASQN